MLLITGIQTTDLVTVAQSSFETTVGNATVYNKTMSVISAYTAQTYNLGSFYESLGIGIFFGIFAAIQYLYFSWSHKVVEESSQ
jgi:hypothetical protein